MSALPLSGYRVLELAHLVAGPVAGMYLADMGANVVKVEAPDGGDASRTVYHAAPGLDSPIFYVINRNKRSLALDLARPEGRAVLHRLAARADVVIEAYRGGVAERLGVDYARLSRINPRLVYCSVSAFGPDGPMRDKPGLDMLVQAMSGLMSISGEADGGPVLCGGPVVDTMGALMAAQGVVTALLHRERTGDGQRVDVSLLAGGLLAQAARLPLYWATGQAPGRHGSGHPHLAPFQAFEARDGWIYVAVWVDRLWKPFCAAVDRDALADDPRFADREGRGRHRAELAGLLAPVFRQATVAEWMARLSAHDVLCAPVNSYADLDADPQVQATGLFVDEEHPRAGRLRTLGAPIRFEKTPGGPRTPAPTLGEHTDQVLDEAGLGADEIAGLRAARVVA
jgi:formyl-CoA transferase/CoA:oxalate CoA-transferase